ncbi:MAG: 4-alpha-glucanotransferase [Bacteroidota bacterium]|nr:4-alpha-glucanotransferase [Bacteroidota bacterium]
MKIHFYIRFHTHFGQGMCLSGNHELLGSDDLASAVDMTFFNNDFWYFTLDLPEGFDDPIVYRYVLKEADGFQVVEGEDRRALDLSEIKAADLTVYDVWNAIGELSNVFFTRPFSNVLLGHVARTKVPAIRRYSHEFRVKSPVLQPGETICMVGSTENLKKWDTADPVLMVPENGWFVARVKLLDNEWPATYKYGIYNIEEKKMVRFEDGGNRYLSNFNPGTEITVLHDGFVNCQVPRWRGAGVAIPVFSLRSVKSFGVGEFTDIPLLVDWAKQVGLQLIQLLPVNDTTARNTWHDSYPYAAISAFALHPLYINLDRVAGRQYAHIVKPLSKKQKQLNELPVFDYEQVMKFKWLALKELYQASKEKFKDDLDYFKFFDLNRHWLVPYAVFSYLRDKYKTADFSKWKHHSVYDEGKILKMASPSSTHYEGVAFFYFVQYHLHLQMKAATDYAHRNKIVLKGDIPIGIHRHSADAWASPNLYNLNEQSGAPPDDFAIKGQNWGFPTYNWEEMKHDGFHWWRLRFDQMSKYFDAFRIDHILGFFRIWSIPLHSVEGIMGRFVPAIPVDISEFHHNQIWFDYDRYCNPFINDSILEGVFQERASFVRENFLEAPQEGRYRLKEEFNTQHKVAKYFSRNKIEGGKELRQGMFDLISNIILFEEQGSHGTQFHFRIGVANTSSFQWLDDTTKNRLYQLYVHYFYRRQDDFWKREALNKLPGLKMSTNMLVCGEDLGMVPGCVPEVMRILGILSLEIERMPKDPKREFFHPNDAPYLSVVTPSTHDMSTIRGWWEEDRGKTQRFYNFMLGHYGEAPQFCEPWINREIVVQHLYSPAMWSIFQLQDLMGINGNVRRTDPNEERINVPSNTHHFWQYRMHLTLESLLKAAELNEELKKYIQESGRMAS